MATANERRPGTTPEHEWKGQKRASTTFLVDVPPISVPIDGSIPGLPAINSSHPSIPGARVDQIVPLPVEGKVGYSDVQVLYSTNRSFSYPTQPIDPTQGGFNSWAVSFEDVTTEIPVIKRITRTVPQPSGGAPVTQSAWAYGPQVALYIIETRAVFTYRFTLTSFSPAMWTAIHAQINKTHRLTDNNVYRFRAGDIVQTTETAWEASYSWEFDSGTYAPNALNAVPPSLGALIYPPGFSGGALTRLPYTQWAVGDNAVGGQPPTFILVEPFQFVPNGWQTLPGI